MEDTERFDPVKGLSPRVRVRLDDAPELDLDENELPAPGEQVRVWYPPESYEELRKRKFQIDSDALEVVEWYRRDEKEGIVALIARDIRPPNSVQVLYGTDWTPDETRAIKDAVGFIANRSRELLSVLDELDGRRQTLEERLEKIALDRETKKAEREKALEEGRAIDIVIAHRVETSLEEAYAIDQARKRALELMVDKDTSVRVFPDREVLNRKLWDYFGGLLLIEHDVGQGDGRVRAITVAQASCIDQFFAEKKPVWVWRDSQGVRIDGYGPAEGYDEKADPVPTVVSVGVTPCIGTGKARGEEGA